MTARVIILKYKLNHITFLLSSSNDFLYHSVKFIVLSIIFIRPYLSGCLLPPTPYLYLIASLTLSPTITLSFVRLQQYCPFSVLQTYQTCLDLRAFALFVPSSWCVLSANIYGFCALIFFFFTFFLKVSFPMKPAKLLYVQLQITCISGTLHPFSLFYFINFLLQFTRM